MKEGYFRSSWHATRVDKIILKIFHTHTAREGQMNLWRCLERIRLRKVSLKRSTVEERKVDEIQ